MKKLYTTLVAILAIAQISYGQWASGSGNTTTLDKVGIGTTSPGSKLYIAGGGRNGLMIDGSLDGTPTNKYISIWQGTGGIGIDPIGTGVMYLGYDQASDIFFGHSTSSGGNGVWKANGYVGIGTTAPTFKFQVESDVAGVARFSSSNTGNTGNISIINASNYNYGVMGVVTGSGTPSGDVYGLGYSSNANSSFNNVLNWTSAGNVGIGTTSIPSAYKLAVNGDAIATSMTVKLYASWPDYVFKKEYKLPSLLEVKTFIDKNQHLPEMPSEAEVAKNGINLGEIVKVQTKKIEELTLYLIKKDGEISDQNKKIEDQQQVNQSLQAQINELAKKMNKIN